MESMQTFGVPVEDRTESAGEQPVPAGLVLIEADKLAALRDEVRRVRARERAVDHSEALDAAKRDVDFLRDQTREIRRALGAVSTEQVVEAARRVVRERDEARAQEEAAQRAEDEARALVAEVSRGIDRAHATHTEARQILGAGDEDLVEAARRVVAERDEAAAKAQRERERGNEFLVQFHDANKRADAAERLAHEAEAQREAASRDLGAAEAKITELRRSTLTIRRLVEQSHALSRSKGWYDNGDTNLGERLMLVVTEVAEAMEDYRRGRMTTTVRADGKPEGFPSEIADVVIRIADMCGAMGIDLEAEIQRKHAFNATRPYRHGGKVA